MRILRARAGMTLTELVVVSAMLVTMSAVVYSTVRYQTQTYNRQTAQNMTQGKLRLWLGRIEQDVRRACYDPTESALYGFTQMSSTEVRFTLATDSDDDGVVDGQKTIGYRVHDGWLERLDGTSWRRLVEGISSVSFVYLDAQGNPTTLPEAVSVVEVVLSAEASTGGYPGSPPPVIVQSAKIEVRNDVDCQA